MDDMIEKVAKAIYSVGARKSEPWEGLDGGWKKWHCQAARAAIEAMRTPNKAMLEAGNYIIDDATAMDIWWAMCDAALSPAPKGAEHG